MVTPPMRILLVDDIDEDRSEMRRLLLRGSERRYHFVEADTGDACLRTFAALEGAPPDCLLLDFDLPDMSALDVLDALRLDNGAMPCAVLVLTISTHHDPERRSLRAGAQDLIEKGTLTPASLTHAVANAVERWVMSGELRQRDREIRRSAQRDHYFLQLTQATRAHTDPQTVRTVAERTLCHHLKASRVVFAEVRMDGETIVTRDNPEGIARTRERDPLPDDHAHSHAKLVAGQAVLVDDVPTDPAFSAREQAEYTGLGVVASASVPLLKDGRLVGVLSVYQHQPRHWTVEEVGLIRETGEHTLAAVSHARAEERLRESERLLRLALQAGGMGVWQWTPETGTSSIDAALQRLSGLEAMPQGASWVDAFRARIHPDDLPALEADVRRAVKEGNSYVHEFRYHHPDGRTLWIAGYGMAVQEAVKGPVHLVGVNFDITARKQAEATVRDSEARLSQLIQLMPSFTAVLKGPKHVFQLANEPYHALVGRGPEIIGKPLLEALPEIADQAFPALLDLVLQTGETFQAKAMPVRLARGTDCALEDRFIDFAYMALHDGEGVANGVLVHGVDRTEQVRAEQVLLQADQRKDEFLAVLAHELRNPLAPIRHGIALLQRGLEAAEHARAVAMMERQVSQLVNLVDDLLDVSRVSLGKIELRIERVPIDAAIADAIESCRPAIEEGEHTVEVISGGAFEVDADRTRLTQVVANLLTNAAKYSERGGRIAITTMREAESIVVSVRDSGIGISPVVMPTLWTLFSQVRDTLDKAQGGLGIGLSLVKKLVELHGGSVASESAGLGKGSTFMVRLPLVGAPIPSVASIDTADAQTRPPLVTARPNRRVLVVDDNLDGALSLAMLLQMNGHETVTAADGPEALACARRFLPDAVLLDIGLPGMSGYDVASQLRADPRLADTLLVAVTGWGTEADKRQAIQAGFDTHLTKPVDVRAIDALIRGERPVRVAT